MSIVFSAVDMITEDRVALKFIDPGIVAQAKHLLMQWFEREYRVMEAVDSNSRSVCLTGDLDALALPVLSPGGGELQLSIAFFPLEWLDGNVNAFFFDQESMSVDKKLEMLRDVFLAVRSVHQIEVAHRDIKRDNVRVQNPASPDSRLKLIDFGMAVKLNSDQSIPTYNDAVGANAFSPPECFLGLEGLRRITVKRDLYSLGAMIYSVFNSAEFGVERSRSTDFDTIVGPQRPAFLQASNHAERELLWDRLISRSKYRLSPPDLLGTYSSVPASVSPLLERTYLDLCNFDYRMRPDSLDGAIRSIDSARKVLKNHKSDQVNRNRRQRIKERKLAKQEAKAARLEDFRRISQCLT
ncbi:MAG: protein kinase [Pseudomonadota bacterium]